MRKTISLLSISLLLTAGVACASDPVKRKDHVRELQKVAIESGKAEWGRWGPHTGKYSSWINHSNRLIPVYSFGMSLRSVSGENSPYRSVEKLKDLYGEVPTGTINPEAEYFDQTDVYRLQKQAVAQGKKRVILFVFDGMDWQTTWAAATFKTGEVRYREGRGTGLAIQDYRGAETEFGVCVTSAHNGGSRTDVNKQTVLNPGGSQRGGYSYRIGGEFPWSTPLDPLYPIGKGREHSHNFTDSASSATSLCAGIKTYNGAIGVDPDGKHIEPIGQELQREGFAVGIVSSVAVSHATPACAWANNVTRGDYQDISRDMLGLPSSSHPDKALPAPDLILGAGWGVIKQSDKGQGANFAPGNRYLADADLKTIDVRNGGEWQTAVRTAGRAGTDVLEKATAAAIANSNRLFGFFGVDPGHLPYQTADGGFNPTVSIGKVGGNPGGAKAAEKYSEADILENPTLSDLTSSALRYLSKRSDRFWLMIEAGDVDWANHDNNLDNSIGAVLSGDAAFSTLTEWIESNGGWDDTAVIVTADHGHYLVIEKPEALIP